MTSERTTGLDLSEDFYLSTVAPLVDGIPHAAALIGEGSEVLGLDDGTSEDHDFGTRVMLFGADVDTEGRLSIATEQVHLETIETWVVGDYFTSRLGFDLVDPPSLANWLSVPTQTFAELTGGRVFHDDDVLAGRRETLAWYPEDVWRLVLAAAWLRVAQHQPLRGRAVQRGDLLGAQVIAARLARDAMRLVFLVEKRWAPYDKWLGTAVRESGLGAGVYAGCEEALASSRGKQQARRLNDVFRILGEETNALKLAEPVPTEPVRFWDRDIKTIGGDRWTVALTQAVRSPEIRFYLDGLETREGDNGIGPVPRLPGAIDQVSDSVDVLTNVGVRRRFFA